MVLCKKWVGLRMERILITLPSWLSISLRWMLPTILAQVHDGIWFKGNIIHEIPRREKSETFSEMLSTLLDYRAWRGLPLGCCVRLSGKKANLRFILWDLRLEARKTNDLLIVSVQYDIQTMFVLNDQPTMDPTLYKQITLQAQSITGYDVSNMEYTKQYPELPCTYPWIPDFFPTALWGIISQK